MNLWHRFLNRFRPEPLLIQARLVDGGVAFAVQQGDRLLDPAAVRTLRPRLPLALQELMSDTPTPGHDPLVVPLPLARQVAAACRREGRTEVEFDFHAIERWRVVLCPSNFHIHWHYDPTQERLERQLTGADHYLGAGWFHQDERFWQLPLAESDQLLPWLARAYISGDELLPFVTLLTIVQAQEELPLSCALTVERDLVIGLEVLQQQADILEVQITTDQPTLLSSLRPLTADPTTMISGNTLLPGLRTLLSGELYELARTRAAKQFTGEALLRFLQDEIRPNAARLGVDWPRLAAQYSILDAKHLRQRWHLRYELQGGIGSYTAEPRLVYGELSLAVADLVPPIAQGKRFVRIQAQWLELTPEFIRAYHAWNAQGASPFRLSVNELAGEKTPRFVATQLPLPIPAYIPSFQERVDAQHFLAEMGAHGLPAILAGLQLEMPSLLAATCQQLLKANPQAQILWIATQSRLARYEAALHALPHTTQATGNLPTVHAGMIYLVSPAVSLPAVQLWTLIVFAEIDILSSSAAQAHRYSDLQRQWAIATLANRSRLENERLLLRMLRALHCQAGSLPRIRAYCIRQYTEQDESWWAKLAAPLKRFFAEEAEPLAPDELTPTEKYDRPVPAYAPVARKLTHTVPIFDADATRPRTVPPISADDELANARPRLETTPATSANEPALQAEWASFVQQLLPVHWQVLAALLGAEDEHSPLEEIARSHAVSLPQLIDEINSAALGAIGDIVIDTNDAQPSIAEEDKAGLTALLKWATARALV